MPTASKTNLLETVTKKRVSEMSPAEYLKIVAAARETVKEKPKSR